MYHILSAHERVSLIHVNAAERPEIDVDCLHEGASTHVVQESMLVICAYKRRVHELIHVCKSGGLSISQGWDWPRGA